LFLSSNVCLDERYKVEPSLSGSSVIGSPIFFLSPVSPSLFKPVLINIFDDSSLSFFISLPNLIP
jgi:hypothetical protein